MTISRSSISSKGSGRSFVKEWLHGSTQPSVPKAKPEQPAPAARPDNLPTPTR